jgi:feruloyl esterase
MKGIAASRLSGIPVTIGEAATVDGKTPYCRVTGTIAPQVRFEVRLPARWTQRYLQTGCGGLCGVLRINAGKSDGCAPVTNGEIVLASTDMGHDGGKPGDAAWGGDPRLRTDFAHRGVHATAMVSKALIKAYYGRGPRYSYFSGCSDGGREALIEAQRYPRDFDGIAAGAPALNFTVQNSFYHAWQARSNTGGDGKPILNPVDLPVLHRAALAACDARDGLADGQIDDPRRCTFDPVATRCPGQANPGICLTDVQIAAARKLYSGARDAQGQKLVVGGPQPGSELSWAGVFVPREPGGTIFSERIALESIRGLLLTPNPPSDYALADWPFDAATLTRLEPARALYDADDPNLAPFRAHGGKLILWHGWSDPHISPLNTLDYYDRVGRRLGQADRATFLRLFLFPAMYHCDGGEGPNDFPLLATLMDWVENGKAPQMMIARRKVVPGMAERTRPVFAYPAVARYRGTGSIDDARSFVRFVPPRDPESHAWLGARR